MLVSHKKTRCERLTREIIRLKEQDNGKLSCKKRYRSLKRHETSNVLPSQKYIWHDIHWHSQHSINVVRVHRLRSFVSSRIQTKTREALLHSRRLFLWILDVTSWLSLLFFVYFCVRISCILLPSKVKSSFAGAPSPCFAVHFISVQYKYTGCFSSHSIDIFCYSFKPWSASWLPNRAWGKISLGILLGIWSTETIFVLEFGGWRCILGLGKCMDILAVALTRSQTEKRPTVSMKQECKEGESSRWKWNDKGKTEPPKKAKCTFLTWSYPLKSVRKTSGGDEDDKQRDFLYH
jgi:hypothetical protein